jgi:hypothetical protein
MLSKQSSQPEVQTLLTGLAFPFVVLQLGHAGDRCCRS